MKQKVKDNKVADPATEAATVDPVENQAPVEENPVEENPVGEEQKTDEKESKKNTGKGKKTTKAEVEIPAYADEILKVFNRYEELYIDEKGGMYTKDTPAHLVKGCVLYKNPYYNK